MADLCPEPAVTLTETTNDVPPTVIGIGASAGGLDAFRQFFEHMPADSGMAFVVILHLPAHRKSMLPEILGRWTRMPVSEAKDDDQIKPDHVYVPPPHSIVTLATSPLRLCLRMPEEDAPRQDRPIDGFFDSLAATLRADAVGIVLSGTGSDGALGLKAIKQCGGLTFAQGTDGSAPQYGAMPAGAIAAAAVDIVACVEAMPDHLLRLRRQPLAEPREQTEEQRLEICAILRARVGHDFSGYKESTFLRRVHRRMQVLDVPTLVDYITRLEEDHDEVLLLFRELLVRVTSFFRDSEIFKLIEHEVIPRLFEGKHADDTVRIWVPGCATGEEVYSLAILLREHLDGLRGPPAVQIFATDIDEPAIAVARAGRYPSTLLEGLSAARRQRFFTEQENSLVVAKEVRELCTFSTHSLVRDPPFSRINMISCRNLLIYLDSELQAAIIPGFHYALLPGGVLLLGSSETVARHHALFEALDKASRIFLRREVRSPPLNLQSGRKPPSTSRPEGAGDPEWPRTNTRLGGNHGTPYRRPSSMPDERRTASGLFESGKSGARAGARAILRRLYPDALDTEELRHELVHTRGQLQALTEEHETALEELRSANEELHSVNEEMQSANEELETSKEEIQSVNEELHTVNAQLSEKVDELDRTASDLRNLFESTEIATIFLDRHLVVRGFTPAVGNIYNLIPSDLGRPLTDIVSRVRYDGLRRDVRHVLDTLEPLNERVTHEDGQTHYIMRILPYRTPDSAVDGTLVTFVDVTSIVQAETHQRLLVDELNHRVKNMLTVVASLARQTLRRSATLEDFSSAFMGRVQALTASYSLLSQANWTAVPLRDILREETRPYLAGDQSNIALEGPDVHLSPPAALAFGMALHELATNAVKHGALSATTGLATICWRLDRSAGNGELTLDWVETGGPVVVPPSHVGFGTTLIERGFAHELSGTATLSYRPEGLRARLVAPLGTDIFEPVARS